MLAKKHRFQIEENSDFFRRAKRWRGEYFEVLFFDAKSEQNFKNTLIVSKKVARSSSLRNRLRRLMTPLLQQELKARPDFWRGKILVVIFKVAAAEIALTKDSATAHAALDSDWQTYLASLK